MTLILHLTPPISNLPSPHSCYFEASDCRLNSWPARIWRRTSKQLQGNTARKSCSVSIHSFIYLFVVNCFSPSHWFHLCSPTLPPDKVFLSQGTKSMSSKKTKKKKSSASTLCSAAAQVWVAANMYLLSYIKQSGNRLQTHSGSLGVRAGALTCLHLLHGGPLPSRILKCERRERFLLPTMSSRGESGRRYGVLAKSRQREAVSGKWKSRRGQRPELQGAPVKTWELLLQKSRPPIESCARTQERSSAHFTGFTEN